MTVQRTKVGIIGCGHISGIYCENTKKCAALELVACADLDAERAKAKAAEHGIPRACSVKELLADPEIGIVFDLTVPKAHFEVAMAAVEAGKSVYSEKPIALSRADGRKLLEAARARKVRVGCAPDTFLGAGIQTCRKLIDEGRIGRPVAAVAFMAWHGPEGYHPDPAFYFQRGGGPMLDMGPYYLTALVNLMGPMKRVCGSTSAAFPERTVRTKPKFGQKIKVETPTHITGAIDFASGAVCTIMHSFDVWKHTLPRIEIHGTEGSLSVPDPNTFGGPIRLFRDGDKEWTEVPLEFGYDRNSRGVGVADMAAALRSGRPHRANGDMAYHVLDVMLSFEESSNAGRHVEITSTCDRPAALPLGLEDWTLDP